MRAHKEEVEQILTRHLEELADAGRAGEMAEHLSFLLEGAVARAGLEGTPARLEQARGIAARMLAAL